VTRTCASGGSADARARGSIWHVQNVPRAVAPSHGSGSLHSCCARSMIFASASAPGKPSGSRGLPVAPINRGARSTLPALPAMRQWAARLLHRQAAGLLVRPHTRERSRRSRASKRLSQDPSALRCATYRPISPVVSRFGINGAWRRPAPPPAPFSHEPRRPGDHRQFRILLEHRGEAFGALLRSTRASRDTELDEIC
jgi:hypothetical protein